MSYSASNALRKACPTRRTVATIALAATTALAFSPVASMPAAFAAEASSSSAIVIDASDIELAENGSDRLAVSSVLDQISAQAQAQTGAAMDDVVAKVAKKVAKEKAAKIDKALSVAKSLKGTPYVYGGSTPSGFDCSGFTM